MANRAIAFSKAPEPDLLGGVLPIAYGRNAMLTGYDAQRLGVCHCINLIDASRECFPCSFVLPKVKVKP